MKIGKSRDGLIATSNVHIGLWPGPMCEAPYPGGVGMGEGVGQGAYVLDQATRQLVRI